jgi:hypothetical protein
MAYVYSVTPTAGINLNTVANTNPNSAGTSIPTIGPLGLQVWGNDGKRYVLAQAGAAIGSAIPVTINTTTFVAASAASGTYLTMPGGVASGDVAWFSIASV